jgi:hypothetical protein
MSSKPVIDIGRLIGPDAKRTAEMEALWAWIEE